MRLGLSQNVRMEQRLVQSPQMIQAMQILQLSSLDLQERVEQEITENPFLEIEEERNETESLPAERRIGRRGRRDSKACSRCSSATSGTSATVPVRISRDDVDRKFEAMQNTPATYHSLGDALLEQLDADRPRQAPAGGRRVYLVYSLDHRGYLPEGIEDLAETCPIEGSHRRRDPAGPGSYLREATHAALWAHAISGSACSSRSMAGALVRARHTPGPHADHRATSRTSSANRLPRIARSTGHTIEEIKHGIEAMRTLDPVARPRVRRAARPRRSTPTWWSRKSTAPSRCA